MSRGRQLSALGTSATQRPTG